MLGVFHVNKRRIQGWILIYAVACFLFAVLENIPFLLFSGFMLVAVKLNEVQAEIREWKEQYQKGDL